MIKEKPPVEYDVAAAVMFLCNLLRLDGQFILNLISSSDVICFCANGALFIFALYRPFQSNHTVANDHFYVARVGG